MNLATEDVRSFIAVAEDGHLTDTAAQLGVPQPTLSRRIARLEAAVGTQLFDRIGRTLTLNQRGAAFLTYARRIIAETDAASTEVHRLMDPEYGTVRLGFMHSLGTWLVPSLLRRYRAFHPGVQFELRQGDARSLSEQVLNDDLDLAFVAPAPEIDGIGWQVLHKQRLALAVPEDHSLAAWDAVQLHQAANEAFIGMEPGYGIQILLEQLSAAAGFTPRIAFRTMEMTTVAGLVSAGLGVALLPMGDPYLAPAGVVLVPLAPRVDREIGLVWRATKGAPAVEMFRDFVLAS
ncbi:LysR family transcriptional regulator [Staphylococcus chromogenes]|nr:LysR family transcriptional regulator [Staphylococcus chromogenes]